MSKAGATAKQAKVMAPKQGTITDRGYVRLRTLEQVGLFVDAP